MQTPDIERCLLKEHWNSVRGKFRAREGGVKRKQNKEAGSVMKGGCVTHKNLYLTNNTIGMLPWWIKM